MSIRKKMNKGIRLISNGMRAPFASIGKMMMKLFHISLCPSKVLHRRVRARTVVFILLYYILGLYLNFLYTFPYFIAFSAMFIFLWFATRLAELVFMRSMDEICAETVSLRPFTKANYIYMMKCKKSPLNIFVPAAVTLLFTSGGLSMFGALEMNLTTIWMLTIFVAVVYISILGYLQYVYLMIYIVKAANSNERFGFNGNGLFSLEEIDWLAKLTKLSHLYRNVFFTAGILYISAFAMFCFLPGVNAHINSMFFYILWSMIFLAIVVTFPVVSIIEFNCIKKLVESLKCSYVHELSVIPVEDTGNSILSGTNILLKNIFLNLLLQGRGYPIRSRVSSCYAYVSSLINLAGAAITILEFSGFSVIGT